jgi:hypothetical protein
VDSSKESIQVDQGSEDHTDSGEHIWQLKKQQHRRNWWVWTAALYLGWYLAYVVTICYISQIWWVGYLVATVFVMAVAWISIVQVPFRFKAKRPSENQVAAFLELHHGKLSGENSSLDSANLLKSDAGSQALENYTVAQQKSRKALWRSMLVPCLMTVFLILFGPNFWDVTKRDLLKLWSTLTTSQKIVVLDGSLNYTEKGEDISEFKISSMRTAEIKLSPDNLVRVLLGGSQSQEPTEIEVRTDASGADEKSVLSLRSYWNEQAQSQVAEFQVSESGSLHMQSSKPWGAVATFEVDLPPVPKLKISSPRAIKADQAVKLARDEVPYIEDTELIPVSISVDAQHPIDEVFLLIQVGGGKPQKELVQKVMVEESKLELDHELLLEPFLTTDLADVIVVAVAADKAHPRPHIGKSNPLKFRVESSYGRYRRVLKSLDKSKQAVDGYLEEAHSKDGKKRRKEALAAIQKNVQKALELSARTPFLNYNDRQDIAGISEEAKSFGRSPSAKSAYALKDMLESFLWEHELLDDRARDRDFFIAARAFSRAMEAGKEKSSADLPLMKGRLKDFLQERAQRWQKRLEKVGPDKKPENTKQVLAGKFPKDLDTLYQKYQQGKPQLAASKLSKLSAEYKKFLEDMEGSEDEAREEKEQKRQQGLANAQNQLRKLQKTQDEISKSLDKASGRDKESLDDAWTLSGLKQRSNIQDTKRLEAEMRSVSGRVGERLQAAIKEMKGTESKAEGQEFAQAESHSDLAARLLRNAESIAKQQARRKQGPGKRRRRRGGENYYGSNVIGGDVKVRYEYEVDSKYRGQVLDALRGTADSDEDRAILDSFLRKILR